MAGWGCAVFLNNMTIQTHLFYNICNNREVGELYFPVNHQYKHICVKRGLRVNERDKLWENYCYWLECGEERIFSTLFFSSTKTIFGFQFFACVSSI